MAGGKSPEESGAIGLFEIGVGAVETSALISVPPTAVPVVPTIVPEYLNSDLSADTQARITSLIPGGWFGGGAAGVLTPIRNAVLGGLADSLAWIRDLIAMVRAQTRIATSGGWFLDLTGWDYFGPRFLRKPMEPDASWETRIIQEILRERDTRKGISIALQQLTGHTPIIYEPWNAQDAGGGYGIGALAYGGGNITGAASGYSEPLGAYSVPSQTGYGYIPTGTTSLAIGQGFYGTLLLPYQIFVTAFRPSSAVGIAELSGYSCSGGGYSIGTTAYADISQIKGVVQDDDIYAAVADTLAAGITGWVAIQNPPSGYSSSEFDSEFQLQID